MHLAQCAPHRRKVLGKSAYGATIHRPISGNHSFGGDDNLVHAEKRGPMLNKQIKLVKAARIEKKVEPFPGGQLAAAVLPLDMLNAAAQFVFLLYFSIAFDRFFHSVSHISITP